MQEAQMEDNTTTEHIERSSTPVLEETILTSKIVMETVPAIPGFGMGRKKLNRNRSI